MNSLTDTPAGKMMAALEPVLTKTLRALGAMPVNYCWNRIEFTIDGKNYELKVKLINK